MVLHGRQLLRIAGLCVALNVAAAAQDWEGAFDPTTSDGLPAPQTPEFAPAPETPGPFSGQSVAVGGNQAVNIVNALNAMGVAFTDLRPNWPAPGAADVIFIGQDGGLGTPPDYNAFLNAGGDLVVTGGSNTDEWRAWAAGYFNLVDTGGGWHVDGDWHEVADHPATKSLPANYTFTENAHTFHMLGFDVTTNTTLLGRNDEPNNIHAFRYYNNGGSFNYMALDLGFRAGDEAAFINPWVAAALFAADGANILMSSNQATFSGPAAQASGHVVTQRTIAQIVASNDLANFDAVYINPNIVAGDYDSIRTGVANGGRLEQYAANGGRLVLNVAGNAGNQADIAPGGVDYDRSITHNANVIALPGHPYITGAGYGGTVLTAPMFDSWGSTDHGQVQNLVAGSRIVLRNADGPNWVHYRWGDGNVFVTTNTYGWGGGGGRAQPLTNHINHAASLGNDWLLIAAADGGPPVAQMTGRPFGLVESFNAIAATPSVALMNEFDKVLAYSNSTPNNPVAFGDNLADYVDAGGAVAVATYGMSNPWAIQGRIMTAGYNPLTNTGVNADVSGTLRPVVPNHAFFNTPNPINAAAVTYFHNSNFAVAGIDPVATLLADDNAGKRLLAINALRNVAGANLFPASNPANNGEFYELLVNVMANVQGGGPCDLATLKAKCKGGGTRVQGTLKNAAPNTAVTFTLDGAQGINKTTNGNGKAKAKWTGQAPGNHTVRVCTLSKQC